MKKVILLFAFLFTISTSFISCRETRNETTVDEVGDDIENAADDVGDGIEEGVEEVDEEF